MGYNLIIFSILIIIKYKFEQDLYIVLLSEIYTI